MLAGITGFDKHRLRRTETVVVTRDGRRFLERRAENGEVTKEQVGEDCLPQFLRDQEQGISRLRPRRWSEADREWKDVSASCDKDHVAMKGDATLRFVTYNVWFAEQAWQERALALFREVQSRDPHVVCLQEVTPRFLELLLKQTWVREHYFVSDSTGVTVVPYGVLMLSKWPMQELWLQSLPTAMGRRALFADLAAPLPSASQKLIRVATVHLESMASRDVRKQQLGIIFPSLEAVDASAEGSWFMGDFNFGAHTPENEDNLSLSPSFVDVWPELRPEEEGHTMPEFDRIDRVLVRSALWRPVGIEMIGTEEISSLAGQKLRPSDHLGLYSTFERTES
ncbi:DUF504 domain-containing protein [Balamuthia mandrillaris]